jgi:tetratricopeptide (TPR) repeat protein
MSDVSEPATGSEQEAARRDIAALLQAGQGEAAASAVREALARWPQDHGLRILEAEILSQSGDSAEAIASYLRIGRERPEGFWSLLRAIRHLRDQGDLDLARTIFVDEVWPGPAPVDVKLRALAWLATAADDSQEAAAFLESLAAAEGDAPVAEALARLAGLRARQGHEDAARHALARAGARGALPARARAVDADLMLAEGRIDELLPMARALAAEEPDKVEHARRLAFALVMAGHAEEALETLEAALHRWPADWILLGRLNTMALSHDTLARCLAIVTNSPALAAMPEISRFQIAVAALTLGRTEAAQDLLAGIAEHGATGPMAKPLGRALAMMPAEAWRTRSGLRDDRSATIQTVRVPGASTALLVFGSPTGGFSHLPFGHFDALVAGYQVHRVYLRDRRSRGFLQGMEDFGDGEAATAAGLARLLEDLGVTSVVTLGASIAGHAAARFGALLGARAAALVAAPTSFEGEPISGERSSPYNRLNLVRRLARTVLGDPRGGDLIPVFSGSAGTRFFYYYGAGTERGERNAARLAGQPAVTLRAVRDAPHVSLPLDMLPRPEWTALLERDLGL